MMFSTVVVISICVCVSVHKPSFIYVDGLLHYTCPIYFRVFADHFLQHKLILSYIW